jgi:hypothetical protein
VTFFVTPAVRAVFSHMGGIFRKQQKKMAL